MKKGSILIMLIAVLSLGLFACGRNPETQFDYEIVGEEAIIVDYTGTDKDVVIPAYLGNKKVTAIGARAFSESDIKSVKFEKNGFVTSIGNEAFARCDDLESIDLPTQLKELGKGAFDLCQSLLSIVIPDGITSIQSMTFSGCNKLASVTFGQDSSLTEIGLSAFGYCTSLKELKLPDKLKFLGNGVFEGCENLESLTVPNTIETIGTGAFDDCEKLNMEEYENAKYLGNNENAHLVLIKAVSNAVSSCNIADTARIIYHKAFISCSDLESIKIPNSVFQIGDGAFNGCVKLSTLKINENSELRYIGNNAFKDCRAVKEFYLPKNVKKIGQTAFDSCNELENIFYYGTVGDFGEIEIDENNDFEKMICYYSVSDPRESEEYNNEYKYWHYNGNSYAFW